jgi:negative regulator of flagellin synthesis FlgM
MKIQPSLDQVRAGDSANQKDRASTPAAATPSSRPGGDRVDLSALSAQIAALESSLAAAPGFDAARVESIKQAIVEGRLSVDAQTVADRMIQSALSMFDKRA